MFVQPYGYCKDLTEYLDMLKLAEKQPSVLLALVGEVLCSRYRPLSGQAGVSQTPWSISHHTHVTRKLAMQSRLLVKIAEQQWGMIVCMSAGIKFFQKAEVVDPDDASKIYCFDLDDPQHCACFNIGIM